MSTAGRLKPFEERNDEAALRSRRILARSRAENLGYPLVRDEAKARLAWHCERGDTVVVVSASLDVYLESWCREHGLALICTELEMRNGKATGRYLNGDCTGQEKKRRVLERYDPSRFGSVYAYGDTAEDDEMLSLAHRKFFRWREVGGSP